MSGEISNDPVPFRATESSLETSKSKKQRPAKSKKADDIAQDSFRKCDTSSKTDTKKRFREGHQDVSDIDKDTTIRKTLKVTEKAIQPPFARQLKQLSQGELDYIMPIITEALNNVPPRERQSVINCAEDLLVHEDMLGIIPLVIRKATEIPQDERKNMVRQVHAFLSKDELQTYDVTDLIIDMLTIPAGQRDKVIEQTLSLVQDVSSNLTRCTILRAVGSVLPEERDDVIKHAKPLFQHFDGKFDRSRLIYNISEIPKNMREQVLEVATKKPPGCTFTAFSNTIKIAVARQKQQELRELQESKKKRVREDDSKNLDTRSAKTLKPANKDPVRFFQAYVARSKIRKILEVANKERDLPLTRDEFEFLANRSIGLRYSEKADKEFVQGIPRGDAVSLSGYPKAQLAFERGEDYDDAWKPYLIDSTADPAEAPKALEERTREFIGVFIENGFPMCGGERTSEYLELLQLTHEVRFLLGNFKDADKAYDMARYHGIGKCGTQQQAMGPNAGRLSKYITLDNKFFDSLHLTQEELDASIYQVFDKIKQAAIAYIGTEVRLHIRKMALMSKELN